MGANEVAVTIVQAVAWPLAVVAVALVFRRKITALLDGTLQRLRVGPTGLELEWDSAAGEVARALAEEVEGARLDEATLDTESEAPGPDDSTAPRVSERSRGAIPTPTAMPWLSAKYQKAVNASATVEEVLEELHRLGEAKKHQRAATAASNWWMDVADEDPAWAMFSARNDVSQMVNSIVRESGKAPKQILARSDAKMRQIAVEEGLISPQLAEAAEGIDALFELIRTRETPPTSGEAREFLFLAALAVELISRAAQPRDEKVAPPSTDGTPSPKD